jgi:nitroreductase
MMDFLELATRRYSVRAYRPDPVEEAKLGRVLEAARQAPTACNRQPFKIVVVRTAGREKELATVYRGKFFVQAPLVIAICGVPVQGWSRMDGKSYVDVDAAIAMDHLILAAAEIGLGTCWIAAFDPKAAREVLCLPQGVEPIAFTPLGYPADEPRAHERKPLAELVCRERWS